MVFIRLYFEGDEVDGPQVDGQIKKKSYIYPMIIDLSETNRELQQLKAVL
jgi:hypothetical protein